jgi:hypothetical protein
MAITTGITTVLRQELFERQEICTVRQESYLYSIGRIHTDMVHSGDRILLG